MHDSNSLGQFPHLQLGTPKENSIPSTTNQGLCPLPQVSSSLLSASGSFLNNVCIYLFMAINSPIRIPLHFPLNSDWNILKDWIISLRNHFKKIFNKSHQINIQFTVPSAKAPFELRYFAEDKLQFISIYWDLTK